MLWDEPTAALDPVLVGEVLDVMEELARERETAMVVVTHEVRFAAGAAHRVVLMEEGRVVEEGTPEEVFGAPKSLVARQYGRLFDAARRALAWRRANAAGEGNREPKAKHVPGKGRNLWRKICRGRRRSARRSAWTASGCTAVSRVD